MRHFKMSNQNVSNLSVFKKQVSGILRKINTLDEDDKSEAINYLQKCIDTNTSAAMQPNKRKLKNEVKLTGSLVKKKFALKKRMRQKSTEPTRVKPLMFKCKLCDQTKPNKRMFLKHLETHMGTPVTCRKCRRTFNSSIAYDWHIRHLCNLKRKPGVKTFKCNECAKVFRYKRHLECHLEGHKRNNCTYCDMVLTHRTELVKHMFEAHRIKLETAVHKCEYCEKRYVKRRSLFWHMQQHFPNKNVCLECGTVSETNDEHNLHLKKHEEEKPYKCLKCGESFLRRQQYLSHLKRHDWYKCLTCKESYSTRVKVLAHKNRGHVVDGLQPRMQCQYCPAAFRRSMSLHMHMKKHTDLKITINCKFCNKTFQSPYKYYKHCMTVLHDKQSPEISQLVCENCGKQFKKKYLLEQHIFKVHNLARESLLCQYCDYKTPIKANLDRHVALHLNAQSQFVCEQCGKTYSSAASLKDHISYMHVNDKQFKCDQCTKSFKRNSDLVRHVATHSDNRPHVCNSCGKAYKRITHLRRHEEAAHKLVAKGRKVQRLKTNENGQLIPVPEPRTENIDAENSGNAQETEVVTVLQAVEAVPVVEDTNYIYFNVIENFDCTFNKNPNF